MQLPTGLEYSQAVQNPRTSFSDPDLKSGQPELMPLGMPKARSGGFATVFKIQCTHTNWAVRCFTREIGDQKDRYEKISEHLRTHPLPYMVKFYFLVQGIRVEQRWLPIVKMEWVQGESLKSYIEKNIFNPNVLIALSDKWLAMSRSLHAAGIAHGDLQHGNVLVVGGELKLVDYDGMFVPGLAGRKASEVGHPNYQHPGRNEHDFGPFLDNFSSWVIYISLRILAANPSIWQQAQSQSDECLVFNRTDFKEPNLSAVFRAMEFSSDPMIKKSYSLLRDFISGDMKNVPKLEDVVGADMPEPVPADGSWLKGYVDDRVRKAHTVTEPGPTHTVSPGEPSGSSWVESHFPPLPKKRFGSVAFDRIIAAVSLVAAYLILRLGAVMEHPLPLITGVLMVSPLTWYFRFRKDPASKELHAALARHGPLLTQITHHEEFLTKAKKKESQIIADYEAALAHCRKEIAAVDKQEKGEIDAWGKDLMLELNRLSSAKATHQKEESRRISQVAATSRENAIMAQLNTLSTAERNETTEILRQKRSEHVENYMNQQDIRYANLPGIPASVIESLVAYGITNAARASLLKSRKVPGVGQVRTATLFGWQYQQSTAANQTMPHSLNPYELSAIQQRYNARRQAVEAERSKERERLRLEEANIRNAFAAKYNKLDQEEQQARAQVKGECERVRKVFGEIRSSVEKVKQAKEAEFRLALEKVSKLTETARTELQKLAHKRAVADRELKCFEDIRFTKYVQQVVAFWHRAA